MTLTSTISQTKWCTVNWQGLLLASPTEMKSMINIWNSWRTCSPKTHKTEKLSCQSMNLVWGVISLIRLRRWLPNWSTILDKLIICLHKCNCYIWTASMEEVLCHWHLLLPLLKNTLPIWKNNHLCTLIICIWSCFCIRRILRRLSHIWISMRSRSSCGLSVALGLSDVTMAKAIKLNWWTSLKVCWCRITKWRMKNSKAFTIYMSTWSHWLSKTLKLKVLKTTGLKD